MEYKRETIDLKSMEEPASLKFLYENAFGRVCLKLLILPVFSKLAGAFMDSGISKMLVKKFIKKNNINMYDYGRKTSYSSYNDFFTRKVREGAREPDMDPDALISPCDSKLTAYKIDEQSLFAIKGSFYSVADLLKDEELAADYLGGTCLIFRLTVDDYHRYCYIDHGHKEDNYHIKGVLHTVQPIAFRRYNVYKQNSREFTVMDTANFGKVTQIEVGALMVGKIKNHQRVCYFKKGREKGLFKYGGSTIIVLLQKDVAEIDQEITDNTANELETIVKMGEKIGRAIKQ